MRLNCIVIAKFTLEEAGVIKERSPLNCNEYYQGEIYSISFGCETAYGRSCSNDGDFDG